MDRKFVAYMSAGPPEDARHAGVDVSTEGLDIPQLVAGAGSHNEMEATAVANTDLDEEALRYAAFDATPGSPLMKQSRTT